MAATSSGNRTVCAPTPRYPRWILPWRSSASATRLSVPIGIVRLSPLASADESRARLAPLAGREPVSLNPKNRQVRPGIPAHQGRFSLRSVWQADFDTLVTFHD